MPWHFYSQFLLMWGFLEIYHKNMLLIIINKSQQNKKNKNRILAYLLAMYKTKYQTILSRTFLEIACQKFPRKIIEICFTERLC